MAPGTLGGSPNGHDQFGVTTGLGGTENRKNTKKRPEQCLNHIIFTSRPILGHLGTFWKNRKKNENFKFLTPGTRRLGTKAVLAEVWSRKIEKSLVDFFWSIFFFVEKQIFRIFAPCGIDSEFSPLSI